MKERTKIFVFLIVGIAAGGGPVCSARSGEAMDRHAPGLNADHVLWEPPDDAVHIDPENTNDASEDGSREHPFDSISDFRWKSDTVYVLQRGTTLTTEAFGVGGERITLASYGTGKRPVIRCMSVAAPGKNRHAIRVDSGPRLIVRDLEIDAPQATCCLRLGGGCRDVQVINCLMNGSGWGLRAFGFSGLKVTNTEIRNIKDDGMFVVDVTGIEIAHCYIHDVNQLWVEPYTSQHKASGDAIQLVGCDDWHVHHNVLDRTNSGNKFCFISSNPQQRQGLFEHNLTRGPLTKGDGGSSVYIHDGDGLVVRYNTICGPSPGALYSHATNLSIYGNIVAHTASGFFASKSAQVAHNVFYQVEGPLASGGRITFVNNAVELAEGASPAPGKAKELTSHHNLILEAGAFAKESLFSNPESLDFRPKKDSRCVDAGCDAGTERDRTGVIIPQRKAPDIGAFELP